jgi:surfeit locus 1 family protein
LAAAIGAAILVGLGIWQLHRLAWKQDLLARIARLSDAPGRPIEPLLADAARGRDVDFMRVRAACLEPATPSPTVFRYALRGGQIGWRVIGVCHLGDGPFDGILVDRGLAERFAGAMAPTGARFAEPGVVSGLLRRVGPRSLLDSPPQDGAAGVTVLRNLDLQGLERIARRAGLRAPAPYLLASESEQPAPAGLRPAPLPSEIPNNHFAYALTWFGLAGALACIYAAKLWEWLKLR